MKHNKKLLVLASFALLGGLMTGCVQGGSNSQTGDSVVQIDGDVYTITAKAKSLDYVRVNETVDLDEYYEVEMDDGTKVSTFSVLCDAPEVKIDGHKITVSKVGDYEIHLAVNDKNKYFTISCKSDYNIELIEFLKTFEDTDGKNYRIDLGSYNPNTGKFSYENYTLIHNQNYAAAFDTANPGALDENGDPNSFILANLSDGNGYMGAFNEKGVPEFEYGKMDIENYYIMGSMLLDGSSFSSVYDELTGEESLVGDASQAKTFLNYGMSNLVENYGYSEHAMYVLGLKDEDKDGKNDTLYVKVTVDGTSNGESFEDEEWCTCKISQVGTCTWDSIEKARTDASYVPTPLVVTEIGTAFSAITAGKNYTTTMNFYACSSDGTEMASSDIEDYSSMYVLTGQKDPIKEVNTITGDAEVEASIYIGGALKAKEAYWMDSDGKTGYLGSYSAATSEKAESTTKDVDTEGTGKTLAATMMANGVKQSDASKAVWKKKTVKGDVVTLTGDIGDNNTTDGQTNGFFQQLFDQAAFLTLTTSSGGTYGFGTYLTMDGTVEYNDGTTCSYTVSSSYESVTINTKTNEISVKALIYLPFSNIAANQRYLMCEYSISDIGTTTNDFSAYANAPASSTDSSTSESK